MTQSETCSCGHMNLGFISRIHILKRRHTGISMKSQGMRKGGDVQFLELCKLGKSVWQFLFNGETLSEIS